MAVTAISQKEYLKRYLSGKSDDKHKKKKKVKITSGSVNRLRIVDDDVDLNDMRPLEADELELYELQEDAPQIAGIIDERPEEVKMKDKFATKKWKIVADENDDGVKVIDKSNYESVGGSGIVSDLSPRRKNKKRTAEMSTPDASPQRNDIFDSSIVNKIKKEKADSPRNSASVDTDLSSHKTRKSISGHKRHSSNSDVSNFSSRKKHDSDSDTSPPRKYSKEDSDESPRRRGREVDSDTSPPRKPKKSSAGMNSERDREKYYARDSPPRSSYNSHRMQFQRHERTESDESLQQRSKGRVWEKSPPRRHRNHYSDESSSRKYRRESPVRNRQDSDESPPRHSKQRSSGKHSREEDIFKNKNIKERDHSLSRQERSKYADSPLRHQRDYERNGSVHRISRFEDNFTQSRRKETQNQKHSSQRQRSQSPQEKNHDRHGLRKSADDIVAVDRKQRSDISPRRNKERENKQDSDSSQPRRTSEKDRANNVTMDGRKAGLVGASELKAEIAELRHKETEIFEMMDSSVSGRGVAAVLRDRKTGKRRDLEREQMERMEKDGEQAEREAKYMEWGKGLKQVTDHNQKLQEDLYEMSKPLARYADDVDLDKYLRDQEREGDPMLQYIRRKSKHKSEKGTPQYEGSFMPNRFGIRPGYRWDGVDRSNGYEKQWFEQQNANKAVEEEAYKWSTSDM